MTASVLAMTGQLNQSPRFITLTRQVASGHDTKVGSARVSRISTSVPIGDSGLFGSVAPGIGRWLVAGGWPVVARLVAGAARKETRLEHVRDEKGKVWEVHRPKSGGVLLRAGGGIRWVSVIDLDRMVPAPGFEDFRWDRSWLRRTDADRASKVGG